MKHLVLLGGGPTHLQVLHELSAAPLAGVEVTLVAPSARHVHRPLLPTWVAGECAIEDIAVPYAPLARQARVRFIESDVLGLDATMRQLMLTNGEVLTYNALSIDADAVANRDAIPGARDNALFVRPVEHFIRFWGALVTLSQEQALSLMVVGGEAPAIELSVAIQKRLGRRVRVALVTGGGAPLPALPEPFQLRVKRALKRDHVTLFEDRCDALSSRQMQLGRGMRLACDAPVMVQEPGSPLWLFDSGLGLEAQGFLLTGPTLQAASHSDVFGVGELALRSDRPMRQATWYPLHGGRAASLLVHNLRCFLAGSRLKRDDRAELGLDLLGMGEGRALARVGAMAVEGRWVGRLKARADWGWLKQLGVSSAPAPDVPAEPTPEADDAEAEAVGSSHVDDEESPRR